MARWVLILLMVMLLRVDAAPQEASWGDALSVAAMSPRRVVEQYDFEEVNDQGVKLGRGLALPPRWYPMGRSPKSKDPNFNYLALHDQLSRRLGFPVHNTVGYSNRQHQAAMSGDYSLHLGIDGGSAGAYLEVGALPAVAGSDYLVTANIRTDQLEHAAARVRTYFVDNAGRRIEGSIRESPRIRTNGEWTAVDLKLPGEFRDTAFIGIELELVQPVPDPRHLLGNQQIVLEDVKGNAWFDDIGVWQLPHVELKSQSPVNIIRGSDPPEWDVHIRDLVGNRLTSILTLYDHQRNVIAQDTRRLGWGAPSKWTWTPDLPAYGWYLLELRVTEQRNSTSPGGAPIEVDVARTFNATLWLPPGTGAVGQDAERFALVAEGMSERYMALLPDMANTVGLGTVIASAWDPETTLGSLDLRLDVLAKLINGLGSGGRHVAISFSPVPQQLANTRGINSHATTDVFAADSTLWMPYVHPILVRQGQRINQWQLGSAAMPDAAFQADLLPMTRSVYDAFRHWTPNPTLILPWRIDQPMRRGLDPDIAIGMLWPAGLTPANLPAQLRDGGWLRPDDKPGTPPKHGGMRMHVRPAAADLMDHQDRVTDLALRMVYAWEQDATGTALADAWTPALERRTALLPDPLLGVAANVAERLSGYRAVGRLNLDDDMAAIVFAYRGDEELALRRKRHGMMVDERGYDLGTGMIVAWNIRARPSQAKLNMFLGDNPVVFDVWGNRSVPDADSKGRQQVSLTETPVFITGVDARLALFRSSFKLDEPFIESTQKPHVRTISLTNPWPVTISGRFSITGPESWAIQPGRHAFSIAPGATAELPIAFRFPINEVAGKKQLAAEFEFTADKKYKVDFETPMAVGLEGVRLEASLSLEQGAAPNTIDATVTCIITNTGDQQVSLNAFANLPGHARIERLIPRLDPGQSMIRQFNFVDAGTALAENDIRLGVRETNGPAVLNKRLGVNDLE